MAQGHRHQPEQRLPVRARRVPAHEAGGRRQGHQHRLDAVDLRRVLRAGLWRQQGRRGAAHQVAGGGLGAGQHPGECRVAGLDRHRADARARGSSWPGCTSGCWRARRRAGGASPTTWPAWRCSWPARRRTSSPAWRLRWTAVIRRRSEQCCTAPRGNFNFVQKGDLDASQADRPPPVQPATGLRPAGAARRTGSARPGLAEQADPRGRAVSAGRLHRRDRAADHAEAAGAPGPDGAGGQQARRQRHHRRRRGGQGRARRLHLRHRHRRACVEHHAVPEAALRPGQGPGGGVADRRVAADRRGEQRRTVQDRRSNWSTMPSATRAR